MTAAPLLDKPPRHILLSMMLHRNNTLFLRYYWTSELPRGSKPTAKQVRAWQDTSSRVALVTGRKVLKTTFIESQLVKTGLDYTGKVVDECLFTTPAEAHMANTLARIEQRIYDTRLFKAMLHRYDKNQGLIQWKSGRWWNCRIEGVDGSGKNMVGTRASRIIADEQAFGAQRAHDARIQVARDPVKTKWLYCGVPNGVRLTPFWRIDQDKSYGRGWHVHRFSSFENPLMDSPAGRESLIAEYGSENENEYLNNVLGLWGEERASTFPSAHVNASQSFEHPFARVEVSEDQALAAKGGVETSAVPWRALLDRVDAAASSVGTRARMSVLGSDHGFSPDPTVIYVGYLDGPDTDKCGTPVWKVLACVTLLRIVAHEQAACLDTLRSILNERLSGPVAGICADMMGYAQGIFTDHLFVLSDRYDTAWYREHVQAANFGGTESAPDEFGEPQKDRNDVVIKKRRKQTSTELLKDALAENVRDTAVLTAYAS